MNEAHQILFRGIELLVSCFHEPEVKGSAEEPPCLSETVIDAVKVAGVDITSLLSDETIEALEDEWLEAEGWP